MLDSIVTAISTKLNGGGGAAARTHTLFDHTHFFLKPHPFDQNRFGSRISDINLGRLMRIAIEGPQLTEVNFHQILEIQTTKS